MINKLTIDGQEIQTWESEYSSHRYYAVNMTQAVKRLDGYGLTESEKTDIRELSAGYCRLIDEAGLDGFGDTEFESIQHLFSKARLIEK